MNQFPSSPWGYHLGSRIFSKLHWDIRSQRCITGVIDTGGKWKTFSIREVLIIFLGHLWLVVLTYRLIFSFKFLLRCHQSDIVSIICHRYQQLQCTGGKICSTSGKFSAGVVDTGGASLLANISANFRKKVKWPYCYLWGLWGHDS
jgi:hypothetical protein